MDTSFIKKYTDVEDINKEIEEIERMILQMDENNEEDVIELKRLHIEKRILQEKKEASITFTKRLTPATTKRKINDIEVKSTDKRIKNAYGDLVSGKKKDVGDALLRIIILDKKDGEIYDDLLSFLEKGAPVDHEINGETPLYAAISLNKTNCAKILLDYGASLTKINKNTFISPLELAFKNKTLNSEIYQMIISKISDLEKIFISSEREDHTQRRLEQDFEDNNTNN
eukprot:TRINITY_DN7891_c0_g1_i1.p1 TRINITY_DN7891_c0_g1~~TRINITY_DN7891_c0_g1_i1.p1  ORF type:complete len:228 (+),score=120.64 TRINITY_DN7891_c0_g1_i1:12-695(+)